MSRRNKKSQYRQPHPVSVGNSPGFSSSSSNSSPENPPLNSGAAPQFYSASYPPLVPGMLPPSYCSVAYFTPAPIFSPPPAPTPTIDPFTRVQLLWQEDHKRLTQLETVNTQLQSHAAVSTAKIEDLASENTQLKQEVGVLHAQLIRESELATRSRVAAQSRTQEMFEQTRQHEKKIETFQAEVKALKKQNAELTEQLRIANEFIRRRLHIPPVGDRKVQARTPETPDVTIMLGRDQSLFGSFHHYNSSFVSIHSSSNHDSAGSLLSSQNHSPDLARLSLSDQAQGLGFVADDSPDFSLS